eukprot:3755144-Pleurochrysis_carterae.AAC.5
MTATPARGFATQMLRCSPHPPSRSGYFGVGEGSLGRQHRVDGQGWMGSRAREGVALGPSNPPPIG